MRMIVKAIITIIVGTILMIGVLFCADCVYIQNNTVIEYDANSNVTTTEVHHIDGRVDYIYNQHLLEILLNPMFSQGLYF